MKNAKNESQNNKYNISKWKRGLIVNHMNKKDYCCDESTKNPDPNIPSNSICVETVTRHDVLTLREIRVINVVEISRKSVNPLVKSGSGDRILFGDRDCIHRKARGGIVHEINETNGITAEIVVTTVIVIKVGGGETSLCSLFFFNGRRR